MYDMKKAGDFSELTDIEKLQEIRKLIERIDRPDVTVVSDHIVNLVGSLNHPIRRKGEMLAKIDEILRLPGAGAENLSAGQTARSRGRIFSSERTAEESHRTISAMSLPNIPIRRCGNHISTAFCGSMCKKRT